MIAVIFGSVSDALFLSELRYDVLLDGSFAPFWSTLREVVSLCLILQHVQAKNIRLKAWVVASILSWFFILLSRSSCVAGRLKKLIAT